MDNTVLFAICAWSGCICRKRSLLHSWMAVTKGAVRAVFWGSDDENTLKKSFGALGYSFLWVLT